MFLAGGVTPSLGKIVLICYSALWDGYLVLSAYLFTIYPKIYYWVFTSESNSEILFLIMEFIFL